MPYVQTEHARRLFYTDDGGGEAPIILIHGWASVPGGSKALGFDGASHRLHQERLEEFNKVVLDWIEGIA